MKNALVFLEANAKEFKKAISGLWSNTLRVM